MGRKRKDANPDVSPEQKELFELHGPEAKKIARLARKYKEAVGERMEWLKHEVELKDKIRELVKEGGYKRCDDGSIRLAVNGITVIVKPSDDKVSVKLAEDDAGEADDDEAEGDA